MKPNLKACGQAMITAVVNAVLALTLMLLVEFAISGTFQLAEPYIWAGLLIGLVIFLASSGVNAIFAAMVTAPGSPRMPFNLQDRRWELASR